MMYYSPSRNAFINDGSIWLDVVPVPDADYNAIMAQLETGTKVLQPGDDGYPVLVDAPIAEPVVLPLNILLQTRIHQLSEEYESAVNFIKSGYPLAETITWPVQIAEARVVINWMAADPARVIADFPRSEAPFLYDLAQSRQIKGLESDLLDLANRVIHNDSQFSPAMALFTAERHAAEKRLLMAYELEDRAALEAVTWSFYLVPPPDMSMTVEPTESV